MDRLPQTIALFSIVAVAAAASSFFMSSGKPCFTAGAVSYQVSANALSPDYRIRIAGAEIKSDLRMQLVDRAEDADFVIVDDFDARGQACKAAAAIRTVSVDENEPAPDVTVTLAREVPEPDYKIYVHSARYSHQDAAALLAAMWKARQTRAVADNR